jgi:hypothetical protein
MCSLNLAAIQWISVEIKIKNWSVSVQTSMDKKMEEAYLSDISTLLVSCPLARFPVCAPV